MAIEGMSTCVLVGTHPSCNPARLACEVPDRGYSGHVTCSSGQRLSPCARKDKVAGGRDGSYRYCSSNLTNDRWLPPTDTQVQLVGAETENTTPWHHRYSTQARPGRREKPVVPGEDHEITSTVLGSWQILGRASSHTLRCMMSVSAPRA
nr:hypothetical protein CFP56_04595 [Quercus suber]